MICARLIAFAKQREKAYRITGTFDTTKAKAISRIRQLADYWKGKNEALVIKQAEQEIRTILPSPHGRFRKQRIEILTLLTNNL